MAGYKLDEFINIIVESEAEDPSRIIDLMKERHYDDDQIIQNLKLLHGLNKRRLSTLSGLISGKKRKKEKKEKKILSQDELLEIFQHNDDYINQKLKISDLKIMYKNIYESEPRKEMKKQELIDSIRYRFRVLDRASHFNKD